jgi:hypothetical protein
MQPYLFPYLGYFQLISAVDVFFLSDDLQYINKGWINRNRVLVHGEPKMITFPLRKASHLAKINERALGDDYDYQAGIILKTICQAYTKAPLFKNVFPLIERIVRYPERNLARFIENSIREICRHLCIYTPLLISSEFGIDPHLNAQDRIIYSGKKLNANTYINPVGGTHLYSPEYFSIHGLSLKFHCIDDITYPQFQNEFVPLLSIIDVMMFNTVPALRTLLMSYSLNDKSVLAA